MNTSGTLTFTETGELRFADWTTGAPLLVHTYCDGATRINRGRYSSWEAGTASGTLEVGGATLTFTDAWSGVDDTLRLTRRVTVAGYAPGGYATEIRLGGPGAFGDAQLFIPGTQYGDPDRANPLAIAGSHARTAGDTVAYIREDRLTAPLAAYRFPNATSLTIMDVAPDGHTSAADAYDVNFATLVDESVRLGALSIGEDGGHAYLGYAFPALEGPTSYRGDTFPDGQERTWRDRFHPLENGSSQEYTIAWRTAKDETLPALVRNAWRWAWSVLAPQVAYQDIAAARAALFQQLADSAVVLDGRAGFPHFRDAVTGNHYQPRHRQADHALMGFTGRSTDCAYYLLRESTRVLEQATASRYRSIAELVLDSFAQLPTCPPAGEGFDIRTGALVAAAPHQARDDVMLLRGLTEGAKSMLRACRLEHGRGTARPAWRTWGLELTEWLLAQQRDDGSVPRAWLLASDTIADTSGHSSYNAISLFVEAHRLTADPRYLRAALAAGEYCWSHGHADGVFVGGTLDNPDVIDKEAGTLSLEGYLSLYEETDDRTWIGRAKAAADYAETWIYIWNIPMVGSGEGGQGWKPGVATIGAQLIASGHSLVDQYMAFDAGNYAKLAAYSGDDHYEEVAALLLHNTKTMLAVPGRLYDLAGPGWQQEHWSLAPPRGEGLHRGWLPWVTCSHIEGIVTLEDFDPALLDRLSTGAR